MCEEIDKDFYSSAGLYDGQKKLTVRDVIKSIDATGVCISVCELCRCYHHKFPTPEQFKKEWGKEYPDDGAVYISDVDQGGKPIWVTTEFWSAMRRRLRNIVCACTPFGKPPIDWRPE